MRIEVISFDVEGTLTTRRFSKVVWEEAIPRLYSEKKGVNIENAKDYIMKEYDKVGEHRVEWYDIKYWFVHFGLADYEKLLYRYKSEIFLYPEVPQVLEKLSKSYKLIINSNSPREFLKFELEKIKRYFFKVFSAPSDFKQLKNTAIVYQKMCNIIGVKPQKIVHVGDRWDDDFISPRKIGIVAYYLDREGKRLRKFAVRNLEEFEYKIEELEKM